MLKKKFSGYIIDGHILIRHIWMNEKTTLISHIIVLTEHVFRVFYNLNIMVTMDTPPVLKITPLDLSHLTTALSAVGPIAFWEFSPAGVM